MHLTPNCCIIEVLTLWGESYADYIADRLPRAGHSAFCTGRRRDCGKIPHRARGCAAARRVLECRKAGSTSPGAAAGGYRYLVELHADGRRLEMETNDSFWFRHDRDKGKIVQVWYNPSARCVERKSWETEIFSALLAGIGAALLLIR